MPGAVGFIGLGNMGGPMALNLAKNGFSLVVHDIARDKVEPLRERGAKVVGSPEDVAAATERTIVMVETTAQAESVILGEHGVIRGASGSGSMMIALVLSGMRTVNMPPKNSHAASQASIARAVPFRAGVQKSCWMSRSFVSLMKRLPITKVISATMMGYQRPA